MNRTQYLHCPRSTSRGIWYSLGIEPRSRNLHPTSSVITPRLALVGIIVYQSIRSFHYAFPFNFFFFFQEFFVPVTQMTQKNSETTTESLSVLFIQTNVAFQMLKKHSKVSSHLINIWWSDESGKFYFIAVFHSIFNDAVFLQNF